MDGLLVLADGLVNGGAVVIVVGQVGVFRGQANGFIVIMYGRLALAGVPISGSSSAIRRRVKRV